MAALNIVGRFRQQHDLRAYRRTLATTLGQDFALRLLPRLIDIPLRIVAPDGTAHNLGAGSGGPCVTLAGASGSGRRLALQQLAMRWTASGDAATLIPLLLPLDRLDDGRSAPAALLSAWTQAANQGAGLQRAREAEQRPRAGTSARSTTDQIALWHLLIHGWEDLLPERRVAWRAALLDAPRIWPTASIIVALPATEPPWPGFSALVIAPPTPALLSDWLQQLVPDERRGPVLEALLPGGTLHALSERLFEVALLAWLAPRFALPATRAELYAQALAAILNVQPGRLALATPVVELQLLAAYGERPSESVAGLLGPSVDGLPRFAHPQIRRYMAARQLIDERQYALLQTLEQPERAELALLIATMIDDPTPLYAALWSAGRLHAEDVLALARCLHERPPQHASWTLRVIGALALLARSGTPAQRGRAQTLLQANLPALDAQLVVAETANEATQRFLLRLFELLPAELAVPRIERLVYASTTPEPLAWALADIVITHAAAAAPIPPPPPQERRALARWSYVQALTGAARRKHLEDTSDQALAALADPTVAEANRLRAAQALLADPALSTKTRLAALALVEAINHPSAFAAIERAIGDDAADIQHGALAALTDRDSTRAYAALCQVAVNPAASWEARLDAVSHLGDYVAEGAATLLDQCAHDPALPLYLRMHAVAALGRQPAGWPHLVVIAGDASCRVGVRASAARLLGAVGDHGALDELLRLLSDPTTTPLLAEALCDALGALGSTAARPPIAALLDRASDDMLLTLAAVRALGRLRGIGAVAALSRLLGAEALGRLQRTVAEPMLALPPERCLSELPPPIALRLSAALAAGATPADRPTTLAEFLSHEADYLRAAAAHALAAIGGDSAQAALLAALLDGATGGADADIIAALAQIEGTGSAESLAYLLVAEEIQPLTRWLVVQHLTTHPAGADILRRMLARDDVNIFTRGALAEALGQRGTREALPLLRQLAEDTGCDEHLRLQAVLALGLIGHPQIEATLIRLLSNPAEQTLLRGLAAEQLPATLSEDGRRFLRDMLRREHPPAPIVAGALRALGRAHDHEALSQMLRYCQDASAPVAQAAIGALAELGDISVTPVLVQVTQNPDNDRAVRIQAIGALLRLGGESYRPLLREHIDHGPLPLQFQALDHLFATSAAPVELLTTFAVRGSPLPLRLWLIESLQDDPQAAPFLLNILADDDDNADIRGIAAQALGQVQYTPAIPTLIHCLAQDSTPDGVRLHCIDALGALGGAEAWLALSRLAEDPEQPPTLHTWAFQALRRLAPFDG
jgi:HEAT repeat protein